MVHDRGVALPGSPHPLRTRCPAVLPGSDSGISLRRCGRYGPRSFWVCPKVAYPELTRRRAGVLRSAIVRGGRPECAWVWLCRLKGRKGAPIALPCTCKQGGLFRHEEHIAKSLDLLHVVSYSEIVPIFCGGGSGFSTLQSAWHHSFCRLSTTCRWQSTLFPQGLPHT